MGRDREVLNYSRADTAGGTFPQIILLKNFLENLLEETHGDGDGNDHVRET